MLLLHTDKYQVDKSRDSASTHVKSSISDKSAAGHSGQSSSTPTGFPPSFAVDFQRHAITTPAGPPEVTPGGLRALQIPFVALLHV